MTFVPDTNFEEKQLVMSDDGDYDVDGGDFDGDDIDNDIDEAGDEVEQGENVDILPGPAFFIFTDNRSLDTLRMDNVGYTTINCLK